MLFEKCEHHFVCGCFGVMRMLKNVNITLVDVEKCEW